jgi:hypothetical protein
MWCNKPFLCDPFQELLHENVFLLNFPSHFLALGKNKIVFIEMGALNLPILVCIVKRI